jgi:hypothetical protein
MATVPSDSTIPPSTHITGMNHRLERRPVGMPSGTRNVATALARPPARVL